MTNILGHDDADDDDRRTLKWNGSSIRVYLLILNPLILWILAQPKNTQSIATWKPVRPWIPNLDKASQAIRKCLITQTSVSLDWQEIFDRTRTGFQIIGRRLQRFANPNSTSLHESDFGCFCFPSAHARFECHACHHHSPNLFNAIGRASVRTRARERNKKNRTDQLWNVTPIWLTNDAYLPCLAT